jgi:nitroreductase
MVRMIYRSGEVKMNVYEAAIKRRSIRRFKGDAVPYGILEKCVDAGRLAPSGMNRQLCEYVIVDDEKLLPGVANSIFRWAGVMITKENPLPAHGPKAYIVIVINAVREAETGSPRRMTLYDVGMSAENIMLVAKEEGIGSCTIMAFKKSTLKKALKIPTGYDPEMLIALGYPDESPVIEATSGDIERTVDGRGVRHVPKRKLQDILHRNQFA